MKLPVVYYVYAILFSTIVGVSVWAITQRYYSGITAEQKSVNDSNVATIVLDSMAVSKMAGAKAIDPTIIKLCSLTYTNGLVKVVPYLRDNANKYEWMGYPISFAVIESDDVKHLNISYDHQVLARELDDILQKHKAAFPNALYANIR